MPRSNSGLAKTVTKDQTPEPGKKISQTRKMNRLKDEVYRQMFQLERNRPGAEMGLALALLRAAVQAASLPNPEEFQQWLKTIFPMGLQMIEAALRESSGCSLKVQ